MRIAAILMALVGGMLLLPGVSLAQTTAYAVGQGSPNNIVLSVPVTASVGGVCGFASANAPSGTFSAGDITQAWSVAVNFQLDCNVASRVAIVSANGGLLAPGTPATGYTNKAPYTVGLVLNGTANATTATGSCAAANLVTGGSCSTLLGPSSATQGLRLTGPSVGATSTLTLSAPIYPGPNILIASAANAYTDTLTVTISASP